MTKKKLRFYFKIIILIFAVLMGTPAMISAAEKAAFTLFSPAFENGGGIQHKYANRQIGGQNISVPLYWEHAPAGTKSFAISMIDKSASNFKHWIVINIPVSVKSIAEDASGTQMPEGSQEMKNDFDSGR